MNHSTRARHARRRTRYEQMRDRDDHTREELSPTVMAMVILFGCYGLVQLFCYLTWLWS